MFWFGAVLLVIGFIGLAAPCSRHKGEYYAPGWVLFGVLLGAVHAYNYVRLADLMNGG
jgi:ABC-type transport system involved in cytochrome c biogenesis permease component